jgi:hypothetical protein
LSNVRQKSAERAITLRESATRGLQTVREKSAERTAGLRQSATSSLETAKAFTMKRSDKGAHKVVVGDVLS